MKLSKQFSKIQSSSLMNRPRQVSFSFRSLVAREPHLWIFYQPYLWWGQMKRKAEGHSQTEGLLLPDTELVIDGFQGSANSFATAAFKQNQTRPVKLLHHRHAPVLIIRAIERGIPVVLTVRKPEGAVISLTSRWPHISVVQGLKSYIGFYSKLQPYASRCVISTFELTTQHLDCVINEVNTRFATHFDLVDVTQANAERQKKTSRVSESKIKTKAVKKKELKTLQNTPLLAEANHIYQKYEELAQKP